MKYEILLFDADNTILDFDMAEAKALERAFAEMGLEYSQTVLDTYRKHNLIQWHLFEQGKQSKAEVLVNRYVDTFKELGLPLEKATQTGDLYEEYLLYGFYVLPHAEEVLAELQKTCKLYLVSNGVLRIQNSRMKGSGLDKYFIARFVSEEVGYPKPQVEYFNHCFMHIEGFNKCKTLIIGDSLTSDIQGGVNAGIDTCWFNPWHNVNNSGISPTYEITDLRQLLQLVM